MNFKNLDIKDLLKGLAIGAGTGAVIGIGATAAKQLKGKKNAASKDLSVQTLNLEQAAPDLIPLFISLEEIVDRIAPNDQAEWRTLCTKAIQGSDKLYNILVMVRRKELRPELRHVGEVKIWAQAVTTAVNKLEFLLPEEVQPPEGQENLTTIYKGLAKSIQENVQDAWLNFQNSV
jgi:hypothetical protein